VTHPAFDSGLTYDDLERTRRVFGVAESQVIRDHLISHLLAAISASDLSAALVFFGGTALCRSFLPEHRLSEDIDLLVRADHDRKIGRPAVTSHPRAGDSPNSRAAAMGSDVGRKPGAGRRIH